MARYRPYDVHQDKFIPISFRGQILPDSFEYALNQSVDRHIDLTPFAARYTNDETGRLAYEWSGTLKELRHKQKKLDTAARHIVARHRAQDAQEKPSPVVAQEEKKRATYARKRARIKGFLNTAKPNLGHSGNERQSNITDPDSAKMPTHHGVIQGYNGIAVVDAKHPIVATAEAHGEGQEAHLLAPMIETTRAQCKAAGAPGRIPSATRRKTSTMTG